MFVYEEFSHVAGKARIDCKRERLALTASRLLNRRDGDGEGSGVLSSDHAQRGERDGSDGGTHRDG